MKHSLLLFTALMMLTNCTSKKNTNFAPSNQTPTSDAKDVPPTLTSTPNQLQGYKWELFYMNTLQMDTIVYESNKPFIEINTTNNTISGNSGCNGFLSSCQLQSNRLTIGMILSTKKFCMDIPETEFFDALKSVNSFQVIDDTLILQNENQTIMKFIKNKDFK